MRRSRRGLNFTKKKKKINRTAVKEVSAWAVEITLTLVLAFTFVYFIGLPNSGRWSSMAETLNGGDQILVNRFIYKITNPKPNDIIVFQPNGNQKSHYYVKRVVTVPGDTVQIKDGALYVNGELFKGGDRKQRNGRRQELRRRRSRWRRMNFLCSVTTAITVRTVVTPILEISGKAILSEKHGFV